MGAFGKLKWYVQILIVAVVCGGALGAVWYWVLSPISMEIETKSKEASEIQARVDKSLKLKATYDQFKKDAQALEARLAELKRILPQDKEIEQILAQVQQSARNAGLKIQQGVSKPVIDHDAYKEWPMEMQVTGNYHSLGAFLEKIRELPRIVNVGKLRLESRSASIEDPNANSIGATYEATTFVYRELADVVPSAEAVKAKQ